MRLFRRSAPAGQRREPLTQSRAPAPLSDREIRELLIEDPERGWRTFIDQYTPALLACIERAGIRDRDEAMELYVLVCERLAADDCARLRHYDSGRGTFSAWLAVLVRHVTVDWIRSRAGRRRLFKSIQELPRFEQRVFELYYWENQTVSEMVGSLAAAFGSPSLTDVLNALARVQAALTERQRAELLSLAVRTTVPASLDAARDVDDQPLDAPDPTVDTEASVHATEVDAIFERALDSLTSEDAAILRLKFVEGLSLKQIRDTLHLPQLSEDRVSGVLDRLKTSLTNARVGVGDVNVSHARFLEGGGS